MSTKKPQGKKTIVVTKKTEGPSTRERIKPTSQRSRTQTKSSGMLPLLFGWTQYKFMLIGIGLIALGLILMLGGSMPRPDVWDESIIYSFRRTVLAPALILAGLLVEVYAIFKD